jgi:hypothetical protein
VRGALARAGAVDALPRVRRRPPIEREQRTKADTLSAKGSFGMCNAGSLGSALRPAAVVIFHADSQLTFNPSDQREAALETKISQFGK